MQKNWWFKLQMNAIAPILFIRYQMKYMAQIELLNAQADGNRYYEKYVGKITCSIKYAV